MIRETRELQGPAMMVAPLLRQAARRPLSISRMLDMGGAPSAGDRRVTRSNANKNCVIQGVCFDFDVLTRAMEVKPSTASIHVAGSEDKILGKVTPDTSLVENIASLLNVSLGGETKPKPPVVEDDLSRMTGEDAPQKPEKKPLSATPNLLADIRSKYASKLTKKGFEGGLAHVERARIERESALNKGDAEGHLMARKVVAAEPVSSRWMAQTGTGGLLQYLTQRSMKLALLPRPGVMAVDPQEGQQMDDFKKQLNDVIFDVLVKDGTMVAPSVVDTCVERLGLAAGRILLVTDRDDYLRAAKDAGLVTCCIRPPNRPRENISSHYMVESVPEVKDIVNEINGISFNAVLKGR